MPAIPSLPRAVTQVLLFALLTLGAAQLALRYSMATGMAELQVTGRHRLDLYAASLEREIDKYGYFPALLGLDGRILDLLASPDAQELARMNRYLERLNSRAGSLSIYIVNSDGQVVASSNWRQPDSFIGENLLFRPYFRQALETGSGRFFGIGTARGEPGYYLSSALASDQGAAGVAVVKVGLRQLEQSWSAVEAPSLVTDENGVVILSSVPEWKFTTVRPLDGAALNALQQTQQYNRRQLRPLEVKEVGTAEDGARLVRLPPAASAAGAASFLPPAGNFLAQTRTLPGTTWDITVFSPQAQVRTIAVNRAGLAAAFVALLYILALMHRQRRRHLEAQLAAQAALQKAHDNLERKVIERTADLSSSNTLLQKEVAERTQAERTLRAAQDELVQAGKLAVIGQLSAGIAHELNQPLAALRTLSGNARKFLVRGNLDTASSNLERIEQLVERMGLLTSQLKSFARKSSGKPQAVPVRRAIENTLFLLEQRIRHGGAIACVDLPDEGLLAWCDPNRLEQVLVNLVGNALDAMEGQPCAPVDIAARGEGGRVLVTVRDRGHGIGEEAVGRLFQPFFTTKEAGRGLGLGLAISAGIVADFGGALSARNLHDGGAEFTVDLPAAPQRHPS